MKNKKILFKEFISKNENYFKVKNILINWKNENYKTRNQKIFFLSIYIILMSSGILIIVLSNFSPFKNLFFVFTALGCILFIIATIIITFLPKGKNEKKDNYTFFLKEMLNKKYILSDINKYPRKYKFLFNNVLHEKNVKSWKDNIISLFLLHALSHFFNEYIKSFKK